MEKNKEELVADFIDGQVEKWRDRKKLSEKCYLAATRPSDISGFISRPD